MEVRALNEASLRDLPLVAWTLYLATTAGMMTRLRRARSAKEWCFSALTASTGLPFRIALPVGLLICLLQVVFEYAWPGRTLYWCADSGVTISVRTYRDGYYVSSAAPWPWFWPDNFPADAQQRCGCRVHHGSRASAGPVLRVAWFQRS
jgi:hypothetical protein